MTDPSRYPVPAGPHRVEQIVDRSRFLCTITRVESAADAQRFIREVAAEFGDATHHCWAYVIGAPGSTDRIGLSDDGEPHGTAGRPMLTVLLHSGVGDIAAVVTRYYGGTKLGTGGLVKAYSGAVQEALAAMPRTERIDAVRVRFSVPYGVVGAVQQLLPTIEAELENQMFAEQADYTVRLPRVRQSELEAAIGNLTRGQSSLVELNE